VWKGTYLYSQPYKSCVILSAAKDLNRIRKMPEPSTEDSYKKYALWILVPATILLIVAIKFAYVMYLFSFGDIQVYGFRAIILHIVRFFVFIAPYLVVLLGWLFYVMQKYRYAFFVPIFYLLFIISGFILIFISQSIKSI